MRHPSSARALVGGSNVHPASAADIHSPVRNRIADIAGLRMIDAISLA
jgi:hypothetical protein